MICGVMLPSDEYYSKIKTCIILNDRHIWVRYRLLGWLNSSWCSAPVYISSRLSGAKASDAVNHINYLAQSSVWEAVVWSWQWCFPIGSSVDASDFCCTFFWDPTASLERVHNFTCCWLFLMSFTSDCDFLPPQIWTFHQKKKIYTWLRGKPIWIVTLK